jgi:hypothetical protein
MNNSTGTLGGGDFYTVLPKLRKERNLPDKCESIIQSAEEFERLEISTRFIQQ